jgi:hypothetical protein
MSFFLFIIHHNHKIHQFPQHLNSNNVGSLTIGGFVFLWTVLVGPVQHGHMLVYKKK